jgi:precorrin-2 dehydrogenase / sirohydrochlorin ferrochelatase
MFTRYCPLFVSLQGRVCLVVGGGQVAERKIRTMLPYGPSIRLVSRTLTAWLQEQCEQELIVHTGSQYHHRQLDGVHLVFAATDNPALNIQVATDAQERHIWCNMATDPQMGSMVVPATVEQGPLTIAISTAGLSPSAARQIRQVLEQQFGPEWAPYLILLGSIRSAIQRKNLGTDENQRMFREIVQLPLLEWLREGRQEAALEALNRLCRPWLADTELAAIWKETCAQCYS